MKCKSIAHGADGPKKFVYNLIIIWNVNPKAHKVETTNSLVYNLIIIWNVNNLVSHINDELAVRL